MNTILRTVLVALALLAEQQPPSLQEAIDRMRATLNQLEKEAKPPEPPKPVTITTEAEFDALVLAAVDGDVLDLDPTFRYTKAFTIRKALTIQSAVPAGQIDPLSALPEFLNTLTVAHDDVVLRGLRVRATSPNAFVLNVLPGTSRVTLDRNHVAGDPVKGGRKGVAGNAAFFTFVNNYVEDMFCIYPPTGCNDTQALAIWDTPGPGTIRGNYLSGGTETMMFGGADSVHIPSDYVIEDNVFTKRPEWRAMKVGLKNTVEFKIGRKILFRHNQVSYSWGQFGQTGYCFAVTPRNQDGHAPQATIEDLTIEDNDVAHCAGALVLLSADDRLANPSGRLTRFKLLGNRFADIDPIAWAGDNKVFLIGSSPHGSSIDTTIDGNIVAGKNLTAALYFTSIPPHENFVYTNNIVPPGKSYTMPQGVFSSAGAFALTWAKFVVNGTYANNAVQ